MKNMKYKNSILFIGILILLILPKFIVTPASAYYKPFVPPKIDISEDSEQWLTNKKLKIDSINNISKANSINCESGSSDAQLYLVSKEANVPLNEFSFKYFLTIVNEESYNKLELSRISFNFKDAKNFDITNYKFIKSLIDSVTESNDFNYDDLNAKIKDIINEDKKSEFTYINQKINNYDLKLGIALVEDNVTVFDLEIRKEST